VATVYSAYLVQHPSPTVITEISLSG